MSTPAPEFPWLAAQVHPIELGWRHLYYSPTAHARSGASPLPTMGGRWPLVTSAHLTRREAEARIDPDAVHVGIGVGWGEIDPDLLRGVAARAPQCPDRI